MDVSILIVNYNTLEITKSCIDSIFKQTSGIKFEVIVVDNASTDESRTELAKDKRIIFIESSDNIGFGCANNLGYKYTKGKYIFLLNSDTLLLNNAIKEFYDNMEAMPDDVACLGTLLKAPDGITENNSYGYFPTIFFLFRALVNAYLRLKLKPNKINRNQIPFIVDYITGADLFIRRYVIEKLGLFDSEYFMYFEETDMQLRYKKAGFHCMIIDSPQIIHLECASFGRKRKIKSAWHTIVYMNSMKLFYKKNVSTLCYYLFRLMFLGYWPIVISRHYTWKENKEISSLFFR